MSSVSQVNTSFDIRACGINPNHWYAIARSIEVKEKPRGITLWHQSIVLYRDDCGIIHALEDRCPHRQVKLSHGRMIGNQLECAYHGWRFGENGECVAVPYLAANQKLPSCKIRSYPVQEKDGFIWVFPGDTQMLQTDNVQMLQTDNVQMLQTDNVQMLQTDNVQTLHSNNVQTLHATSLQPMGIPEWDHLNYIATVSQIDCAAHYSYLIENLMDMYHGHLHQDYQAWADPVLQNIYEDEGRVDAHYQAQSYYKIDKIWSISQLFFPALRRLHPEPLDVSYVYPHWVSTLGADFKIYCLLCPINEVKTRAYLIHFTSLNAFWRLHKLPVWFRRFVKNSLFGSAQKLLDGISGLQDGVGKSSRFSEPSGLSLNGSYLYIADTNNHAIRRVELDTLTVTTLQFPGLCPPDMCIPPA